MFTAQDIVEYMLASVGGGAQDGEHRAVRMAVVNGVREVLQTRQWLWYTRTGYFNLQDAATTAYVVKGNPYITVADPTGIYNQRILSFGMAGLFTYLPRVEDISLASGANSFIKLNQSAVVGVGYTPVAPQINSGSAVVTMHGSTDMTKIVAGQIISVCVDGTTTGFFPQATRVLSKNAFVVTMTANAQATTNVTAINFGEQYTLTTQTFYELPANVKDIDALVTQSVGTLHCYLSPQDWQRMETNSSGSGEPYYYTIMRSDIGDNYQIRFVGVPTAGTIVFYTYRYIPEAIKFMGYESSCRQGTVSTKLVLQGTLSNNSAVITGIDDTSLVEVGYTVTASYTLANAPTVITTQANTTVISKDAVNSTVTMSAVPQNVNTTQLCAVVFRDPDSLTVFGEGTSFPPNLVNCVLRIGTGIDEAEGIGSVTPYIYQNAIASRVSASKLLVDTALPITLRNLKYAISQIIDCSPQMYTAILSACEMWYARLAGKAAGPVMEVYKRDLILAFENDVISPIGGRATTMIAPTPRTAGWYSPSFPDMGN